MSRMWQKFADFLHTANLIPLVVMVSGYHYFQALRSHDPVLVAVPIALFVDLLHFRTVQRAVKSGEGTWKVTAVFTTLLAFGLQWMFYSQPGEGEALLWWQVILFASIVPVGLAIMAWHYQQQEAEQVTNWQALIAAAEQRAAQVQEKAATAQERAAQMQQEAEAGRERAGQVQAQLAEVRAQAAEAQSRLEQVQADAEELQQKLDQMQAVNKAWQALNPETQTLALFNARLLNGSQQSL